MDTHKSVSSDPDRRPFKVIIVGGGIAGLTLANALEKAPVPIDYVVLEARETIAPQVGAGIALAPSGCRVLDQLQVYDDLARLVHPVESSGVSDVHGRPLLPKRSDTAKLVAVRMSYPLGWIERRSVLQALYGHLVHPQRVLTSKRLERIDHSRDPTQPIMAVCTDGSIYTGDLIVGADGVHSRTRSEMWRAVGEGICGAGVDVKQERRAMTAEYQCLFGISTPIAGIEPGMSDDTLARDVSAVVASGKDGRIFWFLFRRMPRVYQTPEIPRFTTADAVSFAQHYFNFPIRNEPKTVTFKDLWEHRETVTMAPLEEAHFAHWTAGRIVCLGDSAHKMTPHTGTGGMLAMEHAAALANIISQMAIQVDSTGQFLDGNQIETTLGEKYDNEIRHRRTLAKIQATGALARFQTLQSAVHRLIVGYLLPYTGDMRADQFCDDAIGGEKIDYLPIPTRSMTGLMPFNPLRGIGRHESPWSRILRALPLLFMAVAAFVAMYSLAPFEEAAAILRDGRYNDVQLLDRFYHIRPLDDFSRGSPLRFIVSGMHFFFQPLTLFAEYGVWYGILLIESTRRANRLNILRLAVLWGILNMWGIALVVPVYYFTSYVLTPLSTFDAADMRQTERSSTRTILPALLATHYATFTAAYLSPVITHRQAAGFLWELFPVGLYGFQALFGLGRPSTHPLDRLSPITRDLPIIRATIIVLCALSTGVWQYTLWSNGSWSSLIEVFVPLLGFRNVQMLSFEQRFAEFLKWDQVFFALPNMWWIGLLYRDLNSEHWIHAPWWKVLGVMIVLTVVGGNGTMLGVMWLYREELLVSRRHPAAVIQQPADEQKRKEA
ncbi:hypothetical protein HK57_00009 [Aspergillus ustus]|uniref:FAD-binding domain-containing protein n=1 Tax=Aspergillus ustus TaxID=40382 RepID=A0A0C1C398_ASPUT|nr:hypothetical protein HK57_00009 [Aspergillus ustus]